MEADFKKGDILIITSGSYSDYRVELTGRAKRDFNEKDAVEEYKKQFIAENYNGSEENFITWLSSENGGDYIQEINHKEFNTDRNDLKYFKF